jgi:hypothetical protein
MATELIARVAGSLIQEVLVSQKPNDDIPVDLLWDVLRCNDSMRSTVEAVHVIELTCRYPIATLEELEPVFNAAADEHGLVRVGGCRVGRNQLEEGLPPVVFPLEDRDQLISALLCAFESAQSTLVELAVKEQRALARLGRRMEPPNG